METSAPPAGMVPTGKPIAVPRSHGRHERDQSDRAHPRPPPARHRDHLDRPVPQPRRDVQRLPDGEHAHRDDHDVDAVGEQRNAEGEALLAGEGVGADQPDEQPERQRRQPAGDGRAEQGAHRHERHDHEGDVVGRAQLHGPVGDHRRQQRQRQRPDRPGDERAQRGRRQRGGPAPGARHLVALDGGDDRRGLAGRVEQDRRRRAAVHAAVVDAGEHDHRGRDVQLVGQRQQQCDGHRRSDAWQHPHGGADEHAEQRVQQVHGLEGVGEAVQHGGRVSHR